MSSGIEARLLQAEAQLATAPTQLEWLQTLNTLRATVGLADTTDPGTTNGRVNLLFRERAFWLYGTGHRLGDLRRLMARYGRARETIFPRGPIIWGGTDYGTATSIPFDRASEQKFNSRITGCLE